MPNFSEERLSRLIGRVYDAVLEPPQWQGFVDDLADIYSGTAAITTQDSCGVQANISAVSGIDPHFARSYEAYYAGKRPWAAEVGMFAVGKLFAPASLLDTTDYERTEYFNDWLKPQDIYYLSSCVVAKHGAATTFLTLSRSHGAGDFSTREFRLVHKLVPHLQRALKLSLTVSAVTQQCDVLARGLQGLGVGAILVDDQGHIHFANRIAEDLLRRGDGLLVRDKRICAGTPAVTNSLRQLIRGAARTSAGRTACSDVGSGGVLALPRADAMPLYAVVCPLPASKIDWTGRLLPSALVFVSDSSRDVTLRPGDLEQLYGLTRAEAKLMSALSNGQTIEEYAEVAGITRATAKSQLQGIFAKMDCHRQSDIVRRVLTNGIAQIAASQK